MKSKFAIFVLSTLLSLKALAGLEVHVFNSLPESFTLRYGHLNDYIERLYRIQLGEGVKFHHQAKLEDYIKLARESSDSQKAVFWIGHGNLNYQNAVNKSILTDIEYKNVVGALKDLSFDHQHLFVAACNSKEILQNDQIGSISGTETLTKALLYSIDQFREKFQIVKSCNIKIQDSRGRRLPNRKCQNTKATLPKDHLLKEKKSTDHLVELNLDLSFPDHHQLSSLQVYVNGTLIKVVLKEEFGQLKIKFDKGLLNGKKRNEFIVSTGYINKKNSTDSLDEVHLKVFGKELNRFTLSGAKTLNGSALFFD